MNQPKAAAGLEGVRILITAGPMRAYLDAVRYVSNLSTGRLGAEIALECLRRGAVVTFVHGPDSRVPSPPPEMEARLNLYPIETLSTLLEALREELRGANHRVCFHAMAVLDYLPEQTLPTKFSSEAPTWTVKLVRSPKVIEQIKRISPATLLVGFKLEVKVSSEQLAGAAAQLMNRSGADIVVANDLSRIDEVHHPAMICQRGESGILMRTVDGKREIARALCDMVEARLRKSQGSGDTGEAVEP